MFDYWYKLKSFVNRPTVLESVAAASNINIEKSCLFLLYQSTFYLMSYEYVRCYTQTDTIGSEVHHKVHNITTGMLCIKLFSN